MEDANIYKIKLKCLINGSLEEDIKRDVNYKLYKDEVESIEMFSRRKIADYFEKYIESKDKWRTIEIMVYWDKKSEIGYEITTGMPIPLLIVNDQKDNFKSNKENEKQDYSKISRYGYFGQIKHHTVRKKAQKNELEESKKHLNELKEYIKDNSLETNGDILSFQTHLNSAIRDSQNYIIEIVKNIINLLEEQKQYINETSKNNQLVMSMNSVGVVYC